MANIHNYFDITIPVEYLNKHLNTHYKGEVYIEGTYEVTEIELYPESTIHTESITIGIDKFSIDGIEIPTDFFMAIGVYLIEPEFFGDIITEHIQEMLSNTII